MSEHEREFWERESEDYARRWYAAHGYDAAAPLPETGGTPEWIEHRGEYAGHAVIVRFHRAGTILDDGTPVPVACWRWIVRIEMPLSKTTVTRGSGVVFVQGASTRDSRHAACVCAMEDAVRFVDDWCVEHGMMQRKGT